MRIRVAPRLLEGDALNLPTRTRDVSLSRGRRGFCVRERQTQTLRLAW